MASKVEKKIIRNMQKAGFRANTNDGFFAELGEGYWYGTLQGVRSIGNTLYEYTGDSTLRKIADEALMTRGDYAPSPDYTAWSLKPSNVGRAIGQGGASTTLPLIAGTVTTALTGNPYAGLAASAAGSYSLIYGDTVQEYRELMPDAGEGTVQTMAMLSAGGQAALEGFLGGESRFIKGMGKEISKDAMKMTTRQLAAKVGKEGAISALEEGGEEVAQLYWDNLVKSAATQNWTLPEWEEVRENFAAGAWAGLPFGGINAMQQQGRAGEVAPPTMLNDPLYEPAFTPVQSPVPESAPVTPGLTEGLTPGVSAETVAQDMPVQESPANAMFSDLVTGVGDYLGIKVDFMDTLPDGAKLENTKNALYDPESGTLYLNRNSFTVNPAESLGHELKHHLDETSPEIMQTFNSLLAEDLTELGIQVGEKNRAGDMDEISSDIFGQIFARPDTWSKVAVKLEEKTPGIGQKFLQALQDFIKLIKDVIGKKFAQSPEAEQLVQHYEQLETEVVNILADLRRKKLAADVQVISDRTIASNADGSADVAAEPATPKEKSEVALEKLEAETAPVEVKQETAKYPSQNKLKKDGYKIGKYRSDSLDAVLKKAEQFRNQYPQNEYEVFAQKVKGQTVYGIGKKAKVTSEEKSVVEPEAVKVEPETAVEKSAPEKVPPEVKAETKQVSAKTKTVKSRTEAAPTGNKALATDEDFSRPEVGESFNNFYNRFLPQRNAIIAKAETWSWGNRMHNDLESVADMAMWKAYEEFDPSRGVKLDTAVSSFIKNAIRTEFRQEQSQNMPGKQALVALDAQQEDGSSVLDTVAGESKDLKFDEISARENPAEANRRIIDWVKKHGNERQQKLVDLIYNQGVNPSDAARAEGIGLKNSAQVKKVLGKIAEKAGVRYSEKFLHHQIVPVIRDGVVREEYEDLLNNKEFTRKTLPEIDQKAFDWIVKQGGILPAMEKILKNQQPGEPAVAELVRRHIMNSDVYAKHTTFESRLKMHKREIDARSSWGAEGRAMQMAAYKMDRLEAVQAFFDKLQEQMPDEKWQKLRDTVLKRTGVDIITLPDDIVKDRRKLDAVLREALAAKAPWYDKVYEFWINAILSGPRTHAANILGNAANTTYELGPKRFVEATINLLRGDKKGASFGDFKAMWGAVNWKHVRQQMSDAWNQEILNEDNSGRVALSHVAIGGLPGRFIRFPGRALKAMDAFFKGIVQPMEAAAMAHRKARQKGLSGKAMEDYMVQEIANPDSASNAYGRGRALELMFQEDPLKIIKKISAAKKENTPVGHILRFMLPFEKTPSNILNQGVRKTPLGIFNPRLIANTVKSVKGDQQAIDTAVELWAEQLLAWGTVMAIAFAGDDDDDGLPWITGSSAEYGTAEANFKRDKIPPYSIRLGDAYYSYQRIEPFSTSLALIVDGVQAWKNTKKGKDGAKVTEDLLRSGRQIIGEKSYLDSLNQINKLWSEPEKNFTRWGTNFAASWVPNVIRQTIEIGNDELRDGRSRSYGEEFWRDQIDIVVDKTGFVQMYPKVDYFGRDVKKDAYSDEAGLWFLQRLTPIQVQDAAKDMDPIEKMIWVYNQKNINEQYYPSLPKPTFDRTNPDTGKKEKYYFDGKNYHDFCVESGKLAHSRLKELAADGKLNLKNPTDEDIKLVQNTFKSAREDTRNDFVEQNRYKKR